MSENSPYLDDAMGFWSIGSQCRSCGSPLHIRSGQDWPMCWECIVSKENALRGRRLLRRIKEAHTQKRIDDGESISAIFYGGPL